MTLCTTEFRGELTALPLLGSRCQDPTILGLKWIIVTTGYADDTQCERRSYTVDIPAVSLLKVKPMTSSVPTDLDALTEAATRSGARPFRDATGHWATAVEVALMDTILSIGAAVDGAYGAGVLPRLRAYKAFRGPANTMRLLATLGPFALDDFVAEQRHVHQLMTSAAALLDVGVNTAEDVDPTSKAQREAILTTEGVPELAWDYFLIALNHDTAHLNTLRSAWLQDFVLRNISAPEITAAARDQLLSEATTQLEAKHRRKSYGRMPEFTLPQLHQAVYRAEYARATREVPRAYRLTEP